MRWVVTTHHKMSHQAEGEADRPCWMDALLAKPVHYHACPSLWLKPGGLRRHDK